MSDCLKLKKCAVIGILNITPDSFSDGGRYFSPDDAMRRAFEMVQHGADIIDIGAQSTRPGSTEIGVEEEWARLETALKMIVNAVNVPVSVDTFHAEVARRSLECGASVINDVHSLRDEAMLTLATNSRAGIILMHNEEIAEEQDAVEAVRVFFHQKIAQLRAIDPDFDIKRIVLDGGIGFGKTYEQNLQLIANAGALSVEGLPVLTAASRKRCIGHAASIDSAQERDWATIAANSAAVLAGTKLVRVHNVAAAVHMRDMLFALQNQEGCI